MLYNIRRRNFRSGKGWTWLTANGWRTRRTAALEFDGKEARAKISELLTGTVEPGVWFQEVEVEQKESN